MRGLNTFEMDNYANAKNLYFDLKRDQGYESLKRLTSKLISTIVDQGILSKDQLSHVTYDPTTQLYEV